MMKQMLSLILTVVVGEAAVWAGPPQTIQDHGKAMLRDAEDMIMHGGMGDGGAIRHHCIEVTKHAAAILSVLPRNDVHGQAAGPFLQDAIAQCKRVADMGEHVDPGASLNPAAKARKAAKEAMKHLSAIVDSGA